MFMTKKKTDLPTASQCCFPAELVPVLQMIEENPASDVSQFLIPFAASVASPDMVCNLSVLDTLPGHARHAIKQFFLYAVHPGLSVKTRLDLLDFLIPYMKPRRLG